MNRLTGIALRNLSRNRRRTLLSAAGIAVGVAAMVSFNGFVNGMRGMLLDNVVLGQTGAVIVHRAGYLANLEGLPLALDFADTPELRARVRAVLGVRELAPRIRFGAILSTPDAQVEGREPREDELGKTTYFVATGLDPSLEAKVVPRRFAFMAQGRPPRDGEPEVVLNEELRRGLEVQVFPEPGARPDSSRWPALLSPDRDGLLNGESVVLSGTVAAMLPTDRRVGVLPLPLAQRLLRMEGRVTEYAIAVDRLEDADRVKARLAAALGPQFEVSTWNDLLPFFQQMVGIQDTVLGILGWVFLAVVLLGIVNTMLMNVLERVREIGTMLAVGTRRRQIVALMVMEGGALGIAGGIAGVLLGSAVVAYIHHRGLYLTVPGGTVKDALRPWVSMASLLRAFAMAGLGGAIAALYPAYRASKLRPAEALTAP